MNSPQPFRWTGSAMEPLRPRAADRAYVIGEVYTLDIWEPRSTASHNHEFAWLAEAWRNLPEDLADLYPTPEHLRKRALIDAGYYDETIIDVGNKAGALRVAAAWRGANDFALVIARGPAVVIRTAKSQSRGKMDRKTFQESKTAIMEIVAQMIGVAPDDLRKAEAA